VQADRAAAALLAGIQGGVVIMLATGGIAHLEVALDQGIGALRGDQGPGREGAVTGGAAGRDGGAA
jgi:hypothetical protein